MNVVLFKHVHNLFFYNIKINNLLKLEKKNEHRSVKLNNNKNS